ncbi:uncharacterized protein LOC114165908 [Vigna unguiculata]|uniref:uncharacterized protein LOC114165908 n=1 Tax=Vigna unguiculata TaxID=3917 RepID=UPI0010166B7E|nr:uncharacterized protein LOC114165908 [Vigna unguiculata]
MVLLIVVALFAFLQLQIVLIVYWLWNRTKPFVMSRCFVNTNGIQYIDNVNVVFCNQCGHCSKSNNVAGKETTSDSGSTVVSVAPPSTSSPVREKFRVTKKVDPDNSFRHQREMIQKKMKIEKRDDRKQIHPYENNGEGLESIRLLRLALALKIVKYVSKFKSEMTGIDGEKLCLLLEHIFEKKIEKTPISMATNTMVVGGDKTEQGKEV